MGKIIYFLVFMMAWSSASFAAPARVVSMNLCTDYLALKIAKPEQLISVSYLSKDRGASLISDEIPENKINHGLAEEILRLKPDLVIAGTYTTRTTVHLMRRLGLRVEEFAPARDFAGIRANIRRMGKILGREEVAEGLVQMLDRDLQSLTLKHKPKEQQPLVGIYSVNSYVSGANSLESKMTNAAGVRHMGTEIGLNGSGRLSLEDFILTNPDFLMTWARWSDSPTRSSDVLRHPALTHWFGDKRRLFLDQRHWICGTPEVMTGAKALQAEIAGRGW